MILLCKIIASKALLSDNRVKMLEGIKTLDDFKLDGKTVLVRIDINTPINPTDNKPLDDRRFKSHINTLKDLVNKKAKIVILAHQGRPGDADFTTLEKHAEKLSEIISHKVRYVDCIFSSFAINEIRKMTPGDIILLENVRFFSEENLERPPDAQAKTHLVKKLTDAVDVYIDDAFATAHRSQPSLVGFPKVLPCAVGRLMEKELRTIDNILRKPKKPVTFVLGGTKADDSIKAARKALANGADYIITGGLVANIFLAAQGYRLGEPSIEFIRGKGMVEQIDIAKDILSSYNGKIIMPIDLALDHGGERIEIPIGDLPQNLRISDIGSKTIEKYKEIIRKSGTIFAKGALGIFENKKFACGTEEIIKEISNSNAFSVIGGGHLVAAAKELDIEDKITHISSGGGASISLLAGSKLPAVEALRTVR